MTQLEKTNAALAAVDCSQCQYGGLSALRPIAEMETITRDLARKLDAIRLACVQCPDDDDARFCLPDHICDLVDAEP